MGFGKKKKESAMLIMRRKRPLTNEIESRKIKTLGEKESYQYLGILEADIIKQVEMKKRVSQANEKTSRNQTVLQESHQKDKYPGCSPCNILGTIL